MLRLFCDYNIQYVHVMLFAMLNVLYFYVSTFLSMCAVSSMAVVVSEGKLRRTFCFNPNSDFFLISVRYSVV